MVWYADNKEYKSDIISNQGTPQTGTIYSQLDASELRQLNNTQVCGYCIGIPWVQKTGL